MRIFALGGYGKTGSAAIKLLAKSDLVSRIAVAGRNIDRAQEAAEELGEKGIAICADGSHEDALISHLGGYDLIVNAASNEVVLPCIRAAIQNGAHYCDMAWAGILKQAIKLSPEAEAAGITAVIATGISPCISNLMGVHAARQLDDVEQLQIGRADIIINFEKGTELSPQQWIEAPEQSLVLLQEYKSTLEWLLKRVQDEGSRAALSYQHGKWVEVNPIKDGMDVPLADGSKTRSYPFMSGKDAWGMLPIDQARMKPLEMSFSSFPPQLGAYLHSLVLEILNGDMDAKTAISTFYETIERDPHHWLSAPDEYTSPVKLWIHALGLKDGQAARSSCWFTAPMWDVNGYYLTSVSLVAAVFKILRGEITKRGVITAEKAFEPLSFLDEVASLIADFLPDGKMVDESFEWFA